MHCPMICIKTNNHAPFIFIEYLILNKETLNFPFIAADTTSNPILMSEVS